MYFVLERAHHVGWWKGLTHGRFLLGGTDSTNHRVHVIGGGGLTFFTRTPQGGVS